MRTCQPAEQHGKSALTKESSGKNTRRWEKHAAVCTEHATQTSGVHRYRRRDFFDTVNPAKRGERCRKSVRSTDCYDTACVVVQLGESAIHFFTGFVCQTWFGDDNIWILTGRPLSQPDPGFEPRHMRYVLLLIGLPPTCTCAGSVPNCDG